MESFKPADDVSIQSSTPQENTPQSFASQISGSAPGATSGQRPRELTIGQVVDGRYRVLALLGRGGIGSVYRVEQILLKREFALKTLNPIVVSDVTVRRLQKEAQAASRLEHPNIVRAVDCGVIDGNQPFLVMDIAEGETLAAFLKKKTQLSVDEALEILIPVCRAVAYAHQEKVIHRDIKPSNIILVRTESGKVTPKVVDFGIAKLELEDEESGQALTRTGEIFGTPLYMSPEQCNARKVDAKSDIYSLGCVLFECLTGTPPYRGETALNTMMQHANEDKPPTLKEASLGKDYPESVEMVVAKMLAKHPDRRYQSCEEVVHHLVWIRDGHDDRFQSAKSRPAGGSSGDSPAFKKALVVGGSILSLALLAYVFGRATTPPEVRPIREFGQHPLGLNSDVSRQYYSNVMGGEKKFRFPSPMRIGRLLWLDENNKYHDQPATGLVVVPAGRPVLFDADIDLFGNPVAMRNFRKDDLTSVILACPDLGTDDDLNAILSDVLEMRTLRELMVTRMPISGENKRALQAITNLKLLVLDNTNIQTADILKLKSLRNLSTLSPGNLEDPTPLLKELIKANSLKRFSPGKTFKASDLDLISKLKNLTHLSVVCQDKLPGDWMGAFRRLCRMNQLRYLSVHSFMIRDASGKLSPSALSELGKLTNLKEFAVAGSDMSFNEVVEVKKHLPAGCDVMFNRGTQAAGLNTPLLWFNPELTDHYRGAN